MYSGLKGISHSCYDLRYLLFSPMLAGTYRTKIHLLSYNNGCKSGGWLPVSYVCQSPHNEPTPRKL